MAPRQRLRYAWERPGLWGDPTARRWAYLGAAVIAGIMLIVVVDRREERAADLRVTRAAIGVCFEAAIAYRADHDGECPPDSEVLYKEGYTKTPIRDAWGHPLRVICPGRNDPRGFDVVSDGPDGQPLGLDRVE